MKQRGYIKAGNMYLQLADSEEMNMAKNKFDSCKGDELNLGIRDDVNSNEDYDNEDYYDYGTNEDEIPVNRKHRMRREMKNFG